MNAKEVLERLRQADQLLATIAVAQNNVFAMAFSRQEIGKVIAEIEKEVEE